MFVASNVGSVFQAVIVLAIVALSPVPLALPSGIAVAVIGLMGAASLLTSPGAAPPPALAPLAPQ